MAIVDTHSIVVHTVQLMYRNPKFAAFWNLLLKRIDYNQINENKILHSSAIYIQSMKITRSLCKKLLMIKSVKCFFFTPSTSVPKYDRLNELCTCMNIQVVFIIIIMWKCNIFYARDFYEILHESFISALKLAAYFFSANIKTKWDNMISIFCIADSIKRA